MIQDAIIAELANQETNSRTLYVWIDKRDGKVTVDGELDIAALANAIADSLRNTYGVDL